MPQLALNHALRSASLSLCPTFCALSRACVKQLERRNKNSITVVNSAAARFPPLAIRNSKLGTLELSRRQECKMRSKLLSGVAALALTGCAVLASVGPASAAWYGRGWGWGWGPGAVAAGVVGGAVAAATSPLWAPGYYDYYPGYGYGYGPAYAPPYAAPTYGVAPGAVTLQGGGDVAYCEAHFRSYNPEIGTYTGYDGQQHPCP